MASPYGEGTKVSSAFSSRDIDILHENIDVNIDQKFKTAAYVIEYTIKTDVEGNQIPLLFYAENYKSDFKVWVDGQPIALSNFSPENIGADSVKFKKFSAAFEKTTPYNNWQEVDIRWTENIENSYPVSDLKYFEANLKRGIHKIRVAYTAFAWVYRGGWIRQYNFAYSLSPAKFWRSFGTLQINLKTENFRGNLSTNLGEHNHVAGKTQTWNFTELPADFFNICYQPKPNDFAALAIFIGPFGIAVSVTLILVIFHLVLIIIRRKARPLKKYSGVTILGSLLVPLIFFIVYLCSFDIIDNLIGDDASRRHGYAFLIIVLYPFVMPPYWLMMWLIDRYIKKRIYDQR